MCKWKKEIKSLNPKLTKEKDLKHLGIVRRKVKDLFYKKMISKSQYNKLENKINKLENEIKQYMQKIASR